jgi:cellulose synthase/poly-beta-1,6-N-acetylglucosamine synthase-like glycosyltransferase
MISFITSVYEGEKYLDRFLLSMTHVEDIEKSEVVLIVNKTKTYKKDLDIIKKYINKLKLNVLLSEPEPIYLSWNKGIKEAKNNLIANANLDDVIYPNYIKVMTKLVEKYKKTSLFCGWDHLLTKEDVLFNSSIDIKSSHKSTYNRSFLEGKVGFINLQDCLQRCYLGCHPVWKKQLHEKYGYFSNDFGTSGDYEFWTRCISNGERAYCTSEIIGGYFFNPSGLSTTENALRESAFHDLKIRHKYKI